MKRIACFLALSFLLLNGCGAMGQSLDKKQEEEKRIAQQVGKRLDAKDYRIQINYMSPSRGGGKVVTDVYSLTVKGSVVDSHLPYMGVAYSVPYGGGKVLTFKDDIDEYSDSGWEKGKRKIVFSTNNDEDNIVYTITVFENASADIRVHCNNREDISYNGELITDEEDSEQE